MRIIIVTSSTNRSGGTRQALYQARGLSERGHQVSLCLPADSTFWELEPEPWWRRLPANRRDWRASIESLFPQDEPAVVHAFHNKAVKLTAWWGLFWGRRAVCVAHRGVIFRPNNPLPYLSPAMRAFIVNSQACARAIGIYTPRRKIHCVSNAVPDSRIAPALPPEAVRQSLGFAAANPLFVYIGGNSPIKGADMLLKTFAAACLREAALVMIGTDPDRWNPLTVELGLAERVRHVGQVENVADYLQLADAFVFPTSMDSAPNTLLEAVRMGLPVIATNVGGVPEIARGNGILVPPGDSAALAEAMRAMASDPARRADWAAVSRELGAAYSVEARCAGLEAVYRSLLAGR